MFKTTIGISIITGNEVIFIEPHALAPVANEVEERRTSERRTLHRMIYPTKPNRQADVTL